MTNITVKQAAALLGVTPQRVRALIKAGMLQAEKWGRDWQIDAESVEKRRKAMEQKIGVSPTRVRKMLQDGIIRGIRFGWDWQVEAGSVSARIAEQRKKKEAPFQGPPPE